MCRTGLPAVGDLAGVASVLETEAAGIRGSRCGAQPRDRVASALEARRRFTLDAMAGLERGSFTVDELVGQDLGVVRSIDEQLIGQELEDAIAPRRTRKRERLVSRWYRLAEEPPAMQYTVELERILKRSGHHASFTARRPRAKELIALVFPDSALGEERILLLDIGVASKKATPEVGKGWPIRAPQLYPVSHEELYRRLEVVRDLARLEEKHVACFGLGAIGSPLALALTREGVGSFGLYDPDILRPGNVVRHALDLLSVGQPKAEALESALARINPSVRTLPDVEHLSHPDVIAAKITRADLVVAAIGNDLTEELLGEVITASEGPPPMLLVRTLHAGAAFRVALMRAGQDACVTCLASYRAEGHPDWIEVPADDLPDIYDTGCATAARPGAGLVSQHAAIFHRRARPRDLRRSPARRQPLVVGGAADPRERPTPANPDDPPPSALSTPSRLLNLRCMNERSFPRRFWPRSQATPHR
jgi:ThiF family